MEMKSPGVYSQIIDRSTVVQNYTSSIGVFSGDFVKGPVGEYTLLNNVQDLIEYYGYPTNDNYNDWYQCYNFLNYSSTLLVSRAANVDGTYNAMEGVEITQIGVSTVETVVEEESDGTESFAEVEKLDLTRVGINRLDDLEVGQIIAFGESTKRFLIVAIDKDTKIVTLDHALPEDADEQPKVGDAVCLVHMAFTASAEAVSNENSTLTTVGAKSYLIADQENSAIELFKTNRLIKNAAHFEEEYENIAFAHPDKSVLKFISRNPGTWAENLRICIATPEDFEINDPDYENHQKKYAFEGLPVESFFEYAPKGKQFGVLVYDDETETVVETHLVSLDRSEKDGNNNSLYIENVINDYSTHIFVKVNESLDDVMPHSTCLIYDSESEEYVGSPIKLYCATDSEISARDLMDGYTVFNNKEELDVDSIIGNELDDGKSAIDLATTREDCIAFIGAPRSACVSRKAQDAVNEIVKWRRNVLNINSKYVACFANYKYQYDRYSDKRRWVSIVGDVAGLRSKTSKDYAAWWSSAGLTRGQILNVIKLAYNPNQDQRDTLYTYNINPIVTFPGQGTVIWGQKTLIGEASSFDRINIVCLFSYLVRALSKMSRYQVMEFNDAFTRNNIASKIKPFLATVKSGRGISDYLVVCDESNNTSEVINHNQLVIDIYIKPTYVAEFLLLRFTNAGTNEFSTVVQGQ